MERKHYLGLFLVSDVYNPIDNSLKYNPEKVTEQEQLGEFEMRDEKKHVTLIV